MIGGSRKIEATVLATPHVRWPLFEARHFDLATRFTHWASVNLKPYEADEGGDGRAARLIFEALGRDGWLRSTSASDGQGAVLDLRAVCLLREICGQSSAIADVALSEPWLGALPLMLGASSGAEAKVSSRLLFGLAPARLRAVRTRCRVRRQGDHHVCAKGGQPLRHQRPKDLDFKLRARRSLYRLFAPGPWEGQK